jgi:peptidoglycan/LPS O-acetylase OafA/YrhL
VITNGTPSSHAPRPRAEGPPRLPILEGLRAWLAWWVFFGHALAITGFQADWLPGILKVVRSNGLAVSIFIILSGFVITHMLATRAPSYGVFLLNRFFRVWPLLAVVAAIGIITVPEITSLTTAFQHKVGAMSGWETVAWPLHAAYPWKYFLLNLSMLHGAIPNGWVPEAHSTQGWSVSLEWQFYLFAPLMLVALTRWPVRALLAFAILTAAAVHWPIGGWNSFLLHQLPLFVIGIGSYPLYVFLVSQLRGVSLPASITLIGLGTLLVCSPAWRALLLQRYDFTPDLWLPMGIWALVVLLMIDVALQPGRLAVRRLRACFDHPLACALGRISYSTYLLHFFALHLMMAVAVRPFVAPGKYPSLVLVSVGGAILTLILSWLGYTLIEAPSVRLGRWCVKKLSFNSRTILS